VAIDGGQTTPAMIVDWQLDPITDRLLHVDLKRIDMSKRLRVSVPVQAQGEAKGVKQQGGLLEIVTREIEIECLPDEIPEHFTVDVTELMIGQALRAGEVPLSGSMRLLSSPDSVIAHVVALRHEAPAAVEAAPEAAAAEPEVIKKGKKEEEGGEAEEKGKKK
jgi:large subunit ribosomal protein L25